MLLTIWTKSVLVIRIAAMTFVVAVPVGMALQEANIITFSQKFESAVWIVGLVAIGVENVGTLVTNKVKRDRMKFEQDIDSALLQFFAVVSKSKVARFEELGASIWVKSFWQPIKMWNSSEVRLKRVRRFRAMNYPHQSGLKWSSRMGVVGQCWTSKRRCHKDLHALSMKYNEDNIDAFSDAGFQKVSKDSKAGFSYEEFRAVTGKYSEVVASPLFSPGQTPKLIGVLSIDRAMPDMGDDAVFRPALNGAEVREQIEVIVKLIAQRLSKRD